MSEKVIPIKKAISIIVVTWILSLITTLAVVYVAPNIFPIRTNQISDGAVTSAKILDGTITAVDLATNAIPFASTYSVTEAVTDSTTDWVDMAGMSVTITLARTSHLLIVFSTEAKNPSPAYRILVQALVDTTVAYPGSVRLIPYADIGWSSYTYNFYEPNVSAGSHTVKIQWMVDGGTGQVSSRTLTVIALPA